MDFKLPNITITTDASPSSNEGVVYADCQMDGYLFKESQRYTPAGGLDHAHSLACMQVVAKIKNSISMWRTHETFTDPSVRDETPDIIGKPVRLKSGGVVMTTASLADDGGILCFWFAGEVMQQQSIPLAALDIAGDMISDADMRKMLVQPAGRLMTAEEMRKDQESAT